MKTRTYADGAVPTTNGTHDDWTPKAVGRGHASAPLPDGPIVAREKTTAHRAASWLLLLSTFIAMAVAAMAWTAALDVPSPALGVAGVATTFYILFAQGYFRTNMTEEGSAQIRVTSPAAACGVVAALMVAVVLPSDGPGSAAFVWLLGVLMASSAIGRGVGHLINRLLWRRGQLRASAVVFGIDPLVQEIAVEIGLRRNYGVDVVGFIAPNLSPVNRFDAADIVGRVPASVHPCRTDDPGVFHQDLSDAFTASGADRMIVGPASAAGDAAAQRAARWADSAGIPVYYVPRFYEMGMGLGPMSRDHARGYPLIRLQQAAHPQLSIRLKRVLDVVVAGSVLLLASPVMLLAAAAVKLTSSGPVLFSQERIGQHGKRIIVRKFRSMAVSDASDTQWNADARITKVGKWLRRLNIDELPQLLTILQGDMSVVGPRPERPVFVRRFSATVAGYQDRHRMPVGLTGLAQVAGLRGDTSIEERIKFDNMYIDQWSLRSDVAILFRTVVAVLRQGRKTREVIELQEAIDDLREVHRQAEPPFDESLFGDSSTTTQRDLAG